MGGFVDTEEAIVRRGKMKAQSTILWGRIDRTRRSTNQWILVAVALVASTIACGVMGWALPARIAAGAALVAIGIEEWLESRLRDYRRRRAAIDETLEARCEWCGDGFASIDHDPDYESLVCSCGKTAWLELGPQSGAPGAYVCSKLPPQKEHS